MCAVTIGAMPRLAWFTPLPPSRSGIAAYSEEILPLLAARSTRSTSSPRRSSPASAGPTVIRPSSRRTTSPGSTSRRPTTSSSTSSATRCATTSCGRTCSATPASSSSTTRSCTTRAPGSCSRTAAATTIGPSSGPTTRTRPEMRPSWSIGDLADSLYYFWPMLQAGRSSRPGTWRCTPRGWPTTCPTSTASRWTRSAWGCADPRARTCSAARASTTRSRRTANGAERSAPATGWPRTQVVFAALRTRHPGETHLARSCSALPRVLRSAPVRARAARRRRDGPLRRAGRGAGAGAWTPT